MVGRLLRSADFERVLGTATRARSPHFAVHFLAEAPSRPAPRHRPVTERMSDELSTGMPPSAAPAVDDSPGRQVWLGTVVPKRHARRAVTRSLLKRQIRAVAAGHPELSGGLWVVRLRAPFDKQRFPSASSSALRQAAALELSGLFADAVRRIGAASVSGLSAGPAR